jgi:hypothetical protein
MIRTRQRTSLDIPLTLAAQLASLRGEANAWLRGVSYDVLRHGLENAHAALEADAVEARRRVRLMRDATGERWRSGGL